MARRERTFKSVEGAVAAAMRMQAEEGYDLFRGQRRPWPVVSSFRRLAAEQKAEAFSRVNQFTNWAQQEPAMVPYKFSSDQALAVAQHYGIPTTFLDFTTDVGVARYFATEQRAEPDADENADGHAGMGCIIALRSAHLEAWVAERFQQTGKFLGPQIVRIDVANLWRLEAQSGVFLVDDELLDDYPFHYLLFPASSAAEGTRDLTAVYPDERSDLELIVDQWFWHEQASAGTHFLKEQLAKVIGATNIVESDPTDGIGLKGIIRPEPHPSWSGCDRTWLRRTERLAEVQPQAGDVLEFAVWPGMDLDAVRSLVTARLPLDSVASRRTRSADWRVVIDGSVHDEASGKLKRQWDALRIDGYSEAQIVASFVMSVSLTALQLGLLAGWPRYEGSLGIGEDTGPLTTLFGCDLLVEFSGMVGYGRARVSAADLGSAVRDDIDSYLPADLYKYTGPSQAERMGHLLVGIHRPSLLFDFHRFADLYARQVIPMSVILRPDLPLYPVLQLEIFGIP